MYIGDIEITIREALVSIIIFILMLTWGFNIADKISDSELDRNAKYNKAIKIEDSDLFIHGLETSVGNAFVYGDLNAIDTVSFPEIGGEYMYIVKNEVRYRKHVKVKTEKDKNGKVTTKTEIKYSWDVVDSEKLHSQNVTFCGVEFPYSEFNIHYSTSDKHIATIPSNKVFDAFSGERVKVKFSYYGIPTKHKATIFTNLKNNTLNETHLYVGQDIEGTIKGLTSFSFVYFFWIMWIAITIGVILAYVSLENNYLEK